ncbi:transmembrane protein 43-like [Rhopilema esculentum]|uniref:transmembrane protein 43-like n=1 Tax=Rhopilema esculentum TaxID=499914 RepID=UPI0031D2CC6B
MYRAHNPEAPGMHNSAGGYTAGSRFDSHTKVSYRRNAGYFERVGSSFCGAFVGIFILLSGFPLLFWNEGRAVQTAKSLDEGLGAVISLQSADAVFESNNNKLVHLTGLLKTDMPLSDNDYGVSIYAVKLHRKVEMYQWVEHESKREFNEGDRTRVETTYSYSKEWRSDVINSGRFDMPSGHQNPNSMLVKAFSKEADPVYVGRYRISKGLATKVGSFRNYIPKVVPEGKSDVKIQGEYFYHSLDPFRAKVGDIRVMFQFAGISGESRHGGIDRVSIIARQNGEFLSHYQTKAGDRLEILYDGDFTAQEIFENEHRTNTFITWLVRGIGWLLMFIGMQMITDIVRQIVSFIPIIRDLVGLATLLLSFTLATSLALLTIAVGWFAYRPLLSLAIVVGAAVPIILSKRRAASQKVEEEKKGFH